MNYFTNPWESLKLRYYNEQSVHNSDIWYEELRNSFKSLEIVIPEVKTITSDNTFAFVCPDRELEFPMVLVLRDDGFANKTHYMNSLYDAIYEYYKFSDFYDEITNLGKEELLSLCISEYNIPVVQWFKVKDTEMLNVRKLISDTR